MVQGNKIGVVILNYKDAETTEKLCRLIKDYPAIDRIVVVDNQSPDDSYEQLLQLKSGKIDVIRSDKNGGYSYGNNLGAFYLMDQYQADLIYIANPDVEFEEQFIEKTAEVMISGRAQAVSGVMVMPDGSFGVDGTRINSYMDDLMDCTVLLKRLIRKKVKPVTCGKGLVDTEFLYGSLFGIEGKVFRRIGGFDANVFLYCEERILGKRLAEHGSRLAIDTSVSYVHRHGVSINRSLNQINQIKNLYRARRYYYEKYDRIGKVKMGLLRLAMAYGVALRRLLVVLGIG